MQQPTQLIASIIALAIIMTTVIVVAVLSPGDLWTLVPILTATSAIIRQL